MAELSDIIGRVALARSGQLLQGVAGPGAINANDLIQLNIGGQLSSVKVSDYAATANAGSFAVAVTQTTAAGWGTDTSHKHALVNPADGSFYVVDTTQTNNTFVQLLKYAYNGALIGSVQVANDQLANAPQIDMLSNGNVVVAWGTVTGTAIKYAIYDANLNVVKVATSFATYNANPGPNLSLLALSGGGFALSWTSAAAGVLIAVLTNAGGTTLAATSVAGVPAQNSGTNLGAWTRLANLSNGNIAMALYDGKLNSLGYAIFTAAGAVATPYTVVATAGSNVASWCPEISVMAGFFAVSSPAANSSTTILAGVISTAGVLQGAAYTAGGSGASLTNDGANFWLFTSVSTTNSIVKLPTSGTGYTAFTQAIGSLTPSALSYDNGYLIGVTGSGTIFAAQISNGTPNQMRTFSGFPIGRMVIPVGDACVLVVGYSNTGGFPGQFAIAKYADAAIAGVAQSSVAAGNAGAVVSYAIGPAGYPINPIMGKVGKAFDNSATNVIGNKGVMMGLGVTLRGI